MAASSNSMRRQHGAALLLIMMVLFVSASTMILATANFQNPALFQRLEVRQELAQAKEMLLAYAMQYPDISGSSDGPGRLPCPDLDNDAYAESTCSTTVDTFQGRLPESLDPSGGVMMTFSNEYADLDRQFWYAVDPNYHWATTADVNTSSATGAFSIDGVGDYVAVLIAPGEAISNQDRLTAPLSDDSYLEGGNQNGSSYISTYATDPENFNDQVLGITRTELLTLTANRVIREIKKELDIYYNIDRYYRDSDTSSCNGPYYYGKTYPRDFTYTGYIYWNGNYYCYWDTEDDMFDLAMSDAVSWYASDNWDSVTTYTNVSNTESTISFSGCGITFTFQYDTGLGESVISRSQPSC